MFKLIGFLLIFAAAWGWGYKTAQVKFAPQTLIGRT